LRYSTLSWPELQKRREADVDCQAVWAHVSNQEHQVSPMGVSDWSKKSVRKSVYVHQDKLWGSAIRENSRLASMERASPDACLADISLIPACGPCSVDLSDSPDLGASLFQVLWVKGLQRQSSCANWSFDQGCPKSCFPHRGLHGDLLHVFIGKVVSFSLAFRTGCSQSVVMHTYT